MKCSKLFSGSLPEMTYYIIRYLKNDLKSLYSCIFVNRFWCRVAIPILWEDPFSTEWRNKFLHHFLDIYFLFLSDEDKMGTKVFRRYKISHRMNSFSFKPLFNYPSFIKTLNTFQLELHVINWLTFIQESSNRQNTNSFNLSSDPYFSLVDLNYRKNSLSSKKMINVLCVLLFKLFMSYNASLENFMIKLYQEFKDHFLIEIYESILKNLKFISYIKDFKFDFSTIIPSIFPMYFDSSKVISLQPFLSFLSSIFSSFKNLNLYLSFIDDTSFVRD